MTISITAKAAEAVLRIAKEEGLEGQALRMRILGGGCAGFSYDLHYEEKVTDMDETFEEHGVKICCDPLSYQYLEGVEIDYVDRGPMGSGFKFINPNVTSTCGCGSSFSVG